MSNLRSQIGRGSLWITATRAVVNLIGLASTIVLARLLVPQDFGLIAIGTTMLTIITAVTDMQLGQAIVHHQSPTDDHLHTAWTLGVGRGLAIAILFMLAGPLVGLFYEDPRMTTVMAVLGVSIFIGGFANPRRMLMEKNMIFWQEFVLNVSGELSRLIVTIAIAVMYRSYVALLAGIIVGQLVSIAISYILIPYSPRFTVSKFRDMWSFSFWLTLSQIVTTINWRFDSLLVGKILGTAELGAYTVGNNLAVIPTRESTAPLVGTLYPAFASLRDDKERMRSAYLKAQTFVTMIALPFGVGTACIAHPLVLLMMGEKWGMVVTVMQILCPVFAFQTLGALAQPLAMANGQTKSLFSRDVQMLAIRLPMVIVGMAAAGLPGLLLGRAASAVIGHLYQMKIVKEVADISLWTQLSVNYRAITGVAIMVVSVNFIDILFSELHHPSMLLTRIAVMVIGGAISYILPLFILWKIAGFPDGAEQNIIDIIKKIAIFSRISLFKSRILDI